MLQALFNVYYQRKLRGPALVAENVDLFFFFRAAPTKSPAAGRETPELFSTNTAEVAVRFK
jgi:hypothetical protein